MNLLVDTGAPLLLAWRTAQAARRAGVSFKASVAQAYDFGNRSVWLVVSGLGFFGAVMVTIAETQARRVTGNLSVVGPAYFELLVREFGPIISTLLAAARSGASHSAELAWMAVDEQVEALELSAADPLSELVAPRVLGCAFAMPLLCVVGTVAACLSAVVTAQWAFEANGLSFIDARFVGLPDLACAFSKSLLCGLYVPLAAAWRGLAARGGSHAVGVATTAGVVQACFGCLVIDLLMDQSFLLLHL